DGAVRGAGGRRVRLHRRLRPAVGGATHRPRSSGAALGTTGDADLHAARADPVRVRLGPRDGDDDRCDPGWVSPRGGRAASHAPGPGRDARRLPPSRAPAPRHPPSGAEPGRIASRPMILAIDQGTTGSTCIVFDEQGRERGRAYTEFEQYFPKPGWV